MINYAETAVGDILRLTGVGAVGYAKLGDLLRVKKVSANSVVVEDRDGDECEFVFNCGAARLEPTEWKQDFPVSDEEITDAPKRKVGQLCSMTIHEDDTPCGAELRFNVAKNHWFCPQCDTIYEDHGEHPGRDSE